jgi:hypothetical protein
MTLFRMLLAARRSLAPLATMSAIALAGLSTHADATTLTLVGFSQKVCQLTGDTDWTTGLPTAAQTNTNFGLVGVDLGFPVDSGAGGPLYFLFGDAFPSTTGAVIPPDDALGVTTRTAAPASETCLDLKLVSQAPGTFAHPTVSPAILQGTFNVPTGGVFVDKTFYAFFWTDHCAALPTTPLGPNPDTPLQLPAPYLGCPQIPQLNEIGRSVLAHASPTAPATFERGHPFHSPIIRIDPLAITMPSGFVYASAAAPRPVVRAPPEFGGERRETFVPVFGVARYRASIPYLAMAPQETFGDPATWRFYAGQRNGNPKFVSRQEWESGRTATGDWTPPKGAELYADSVINGIDERCVGEHSVTWNAALRTWLLLYVCGPFRVEARTAPDPWGPWSPPTVLLSLLHDPGVVCTLINPAPTEPACVPAKPNFWESITHTDPGGFFYAPFALERFTQDLTSADTGGTRTANIFWLVSTWNPYQVIVMQSKLQLAP